MSREELIAQVEAKLIDVQAQSKRVPVLGWEDAKLDGWVEALRWVLNEVQR